MENFFKKNNGKINMKRVILIIVAILLVISILTLLIIYCKNIKFRRWTDKNILRKEIKQGNTVSIEFNGEQNSNVYAFDKYIVILENKELKIYDSIGVEIEKIAVEINNPIFHTAGRYLVIAEENGENVYVLSGKRMIWNSAVEGKIEEVQINENGYLGVVISDISYKNIIDIYDATGKSLFKTYVASNKVIDITLSKNNKYLAIAEADISGTMVQSSIRVISIEKAITDPSNSIINTYYSEIGKIIMNIEYQNKERLVCLYNDSIVCIDDNNEKTIIKLEDKNTTFATIELKNRIAIVKEQNIEEYNSKSITSITNISNNKEKTYEIEQIPKEIATYENVIALNFGSELHLINNNGWLMKKYISEQEINDIAISNKIVGIIYRDKIEIIEL